VNASCARIVSRLKDEPLADTRVAQRLRVEVGALVRCRRTPRARSHNRAREQTREKYFAITKNRTE